MGRIGASPLALTLLLGCKHPSGPYVDAGATRAAPDAQAPAHKFDLQVPDLSLSWKTVSGTYTIGAPDALSLYYADTSLNPVIINLPLTWQLYSGRTYYFVDIRQNAGTNSITLVPSGTDKINGTAGNYVISATGSYTIITTDGNGSWYADAIAALNPAAFIAFGPNPPTLGQIRFSYPFNIYSTAQTGGASTVVTWLRSVADDSIQMGGPGAAGMNYTVYKPNSNSDRNIVLQLYADSTQPTKDYIGFGGPDPNNPNGTNPFASGGFIRIPTGGFQVIEQRNPGNTGSYHIINTSGGTTLGDLSGPGNTFVNSQNNLFIQENAQCSVHLNDNSNDCLFVSGHGNAETDWTFGVNVTLGQVGWLAAGPTSTASGANLNINAESATGAAHNGGSLNLNSGGSGSATQGTVNLQCGGTNGTGTSVLTVCDSGLHLRSSSVPITTGTATLTAAQYQFPYIILTGSISGNVTVVFPTTVGAEWTVDASAVTLNAHTITLQANSVAWATTVATTNLYQVTYGGSGKLYGVTLAP